jgi:AcrR family transcriptional regulator
MSMRAPSPSRDDLTTDERLLDAAEGLFADRGIDAVSVRSITQAAGANLAAIHYHFGSKLDLVRALVERRVAEVDGSRAVLLDALEAADTVDARGVAEAWLRPLAEMALSPTGTRARYVAFLAVLQAGGPELRSIGSAAFAPQYARFAVLLERALPGVPAPVRAMRFAMAADATIRALADLDRTTAPWRHAALPIQPHDLVDHLIDAIAGTLAGFTVPNNTAARSRP